MKKKTIKKIMESNPMSIVIPKKDYKWIKKHYGKKILDGTVKVYFK